MQECLITLKQRLGKYREKQKKHITFIRTGPNE